MDPEHLHDRRSHAHRNAHRAHADAHAYTYANPHPHGHAHAVACPHLAIRRHADAGAIAHARPTADAAPRSDLPVLRCADRLPGLEFAQRGGPE